jgi:YbbR domain-containing protein
MQGKKLLKSFFADWPAKVLSLVLALFLTLFFQLTRLEQRSLNIPLSVSVNEEMAPSSQYPQTIKVTLRGERDAIYAVREDDISASLDLASIKSEGVYRVPIRLTKRGDALSVDPLEIKAEPAEIAIGIERRVAKKVPVTPAFKGFLESGYELASFEIAPTEVTISGPAGLVARTTEIATDTIELGGKKSDFTVNVRLAKKDSLLQIEGKDTVVFSAKVKRSLEAKTFSGIPITVTGLSPMLAVADLLPTGNARVHVPQDMQKPLDPSTILSVDLSQFTKPGIYTVEVAANLPEGSVLETYEPQTLTIRLQSANPGVLGRTFGLLPGQLLEQPSGNTAGSTGGGTGGSAGGSGRIWTGGSAGSGTGSGTSSGIGSGGSFSGNVTQSGEGR